MQIKTTVKNQLEWPSVKSLHVYIQQMLQSVWRKGNSPILLVGTWVGTDSIESSMKVPQKTKSRIIFIWSSNPIPGHILRQNYKQKDTRVPMFKEALFTVTKTWKQHKCPSTDEWIKSFTYSVIKKEQNNVICSNTDATGEYHTKRSKSEREI